MARAVGADELTVVVDGDVTLDWCLARGGDPAKPTVSASTEGGGAALLGRLVEKVAQDLAGKQRLSVHSPSEPEPGGPEQGDIPHRFAIWSRFPEGDGHAWRVETQLGVQPAATEPGAKRSSGPERADLVVLHDTGLGFRDRSERWPRAIEKKGSEPPWILLRMTQPVAEGKLWRHLLQFGERLIVVIHIDDLRLGTLHISRGLSWERTAQDVMYELLYHPQAGRLGECAHVVVSLRTAGALVFSPGKNRERPPCRLVFDPGAMEQTWSEPHPGRMVGGVTALTASIAREVMLNPGAPQVIRGVQRGTAAMRTLHLEGYAERPQPPGEVGVEYPLERIARALASRRRPFAESPVCGPSRSRTGLAEDRDQRRAWTILKERHPGNLEQLATDVVLKGHTKALPEVPKGEFGKLLTFDRHEIEGLQSIRMLIDQYARREGASPPLSIAVFGPPGAGKSWSVEQVAKAVLRQEVEPKSFNLSQFDDPHELIDALHQVRDVSLTGKLPLVLWDEFDVTRLAAGRPQELGWLAHFLAPMADGEFQDGQLTHPIGRAVFVFAGGRFEHMDEFAKATKEHDDAKAPDFLSRLSGYVNVVGPNPRGSARDDRYFLIRRAVMIRSLLHRHWEDVFHDADGPKRPEIDEGVLRALLLTRKYRHGVRSLASIIATSAVPGRDRFERSDLPAEPQLNLHVDARNFLDLVHPPSRIEGELLESLAEAIHIRYCAERLDRGGSWAGHDQDYLRRNPTLARFAGRKRDPAAVDPALVPYEELSEARKDEWRDQVKEIPGELASAGFVIRSVRREEPLEDLLSLRAKLEAAVVERAASDGKPEHLEEARAAIAEMRHKLNAPAEFHDADIRFHLALAAASGNEAMRLLMLGIRGAIAAYLEETPSEDREATLRRRADEHAAILQAVEHHQGERAGELIRQHLNNFYRERNASMKSPSQP